jgi:hypothetical protein
MEEFFGEAGEKTSKHELPPPMDGPPDIEQLMSIGEKHGMKMKPPEGAPA